MDLVSRARCADRTKIDAFDQQGITQAKVRHAAGAETMPRLARLVQDYKPRLRSERLDEPTITSSARPAAQLTHGAEFDAIGQYVRFP